jgi:hypothetical protein
MWVSSLGEYLKRPVAAACRILGLWAAGLVKPRSGRLRISRRRTSAVSQLFLGTLWAVTPEAVSSQPNGHKNLKMTDQGAPFCSVCLGGPHAQSGVLSARRAAAESVVFRHNFC